MIYSLGISYELLGESLSVAIQVEKSLLASRICKKCELRFESCTLKVVLSVLDMADINIILGMSREAHCY